MDRLVSVALPLPLQTAFTYRLGAGEREAGRGVRVLVPFGSRRVIGIVTGPASGEAPANVKGVLHVLDEEPLPPPRLLDLAAWVSEHYLAAPGECYRLVLPPAGVRAGRATARLTSATDSQDPVVEALRAGPLPVSTLARRLGRDPSAGLARLRQQGVVTVEQDLQAPAFREVAWAVLEGEAPDRVGSAQAELLAALRAAGGRSRVSALLAGRPSRRASLKKLEVAGALRLEMVRERRDPPIAEAPLPARVQLTAHQASAVETVGRALDGRHFEPFLLQGVTGSGKTEVYFRLAERTLDAGRGVLVLVPEIALTPLLVRAAAARFGRRVTVLHSGLAAGERHDQWWRIREGDAPLVVGARSAVFAPLPNLGLVVVDEEHESSYKQEESPRYHGRDVAVKRAHLEGVPVVLGSATPSVESHRHALSGKYTHLALPERIGPRGLPRVEVVDRRAVLRAGGDLILSPPLREALALRLTRREQALLLLNRRGYATSLLCRECGQQAFCPNCSVSLTLHEGGRLALCHYCGSQGPPPGTCPSCRGEYLRMTGYGTERVLEAVRALFPEARVDRLDRDLASRRGELERVLTRFEAGETDVLVGTQMIAKGHDFPRVTLVGVIDADVGLGMPDFRAAERTFQLLTQVAGRAGRAELPGDVILQSHLPDHYALVEACAQDYRSFYEREMEFRSTMGYPPVAAMVNLILRGRDAGAVAAEADAVGRALRERAAARYRVLGPARAPLARLRQEHRFQLLMKGARAAMREAVRQVLVARHGEVRWPGVSVDVDPLSVM